MSSKDDIADWDRIADTYASGVENGPRFAYMTDVLLGLLGDVEGLKVLDLGCGNGWLAGRLQALGADVTGIDGSSALLGRARDRYPAIRFEQCDLAEGLPDLVDEFDIVVSHTVLMDIPSLHPLMNDVSAALSSTGRLVFSLLHPCFWNQRSHVDQETGEWHKRVTGYLELVTWRVEGFGGHNHYHRPISFYIEALDQAGLVVRRLLEPVHEPTGESAIPETFIRRFPLFLLVEAVKLT